MSIRIGLDRSIFHGRDSTRLLNSQLISFCRSGQYSVYHSIVLVEETLKLLEKPETRADVEKEIKFLVDAGNGRWFRDPWDIWSGELEGKSKHDYLFLSRREQIKYGRILTDSRNLTGKVLKNSLDEANRSKIGERKDAMKKAFVELRQTPSDTFRCNLRLRPPSEAFELYSSSFIDDVGAEVIRWMTVQGLLTMKKIDATSLVDNWKTNKARFPYFTFFVKAYTYAMYYADVEQNLPLDHNTLMDVYFLGTARDLDIIVSNERKFMKSAFNALYGETKQYISLDAFLSRLSSN